MNDIPSKASCHCGAVQLSFVMANGLDELRRCDCSLCRRIKPAAITARLNELEVVSGTDSLSLYQFGTKTAKHYFCSICGTHTHHQRRSNPNEFGVNVGCLEGVDPRLAGQAEWADGINHPSDR